MDLMGRRAASSQNHRRRVIVLGASNVARSISTLVGVLEATFEEPLEIFAAIGNGRGYRSDSRFIWRWLPAIEDCEIWNRLPHVPAKETTAIVTDIGNDLLYGRSADEICDSIERCIERLLVANANVVITGLPLSGIRGQSAKARAILRQVFYPLSQGSLDEILVQAVALDQRVQDAANRWSIRWIRPLPEWYGWDPIHVRMRNWTEFWTTCCETWRDGCDGEETLVSASASRWLRLSLKAAMGQRTLGIPHRRLKTVTIGKRGTQIAFF